MRLNVTSDLIEPLKEAGYHIEPDVTAPSETVIVEIPVEIKGDEGKTTSLHCSRAELGPKDESGRRRPVPVEGSDYFIKVDAVIPAIGQRVARRRSGRHYWLTRPSGG